MSSKKKKVGNWWLITLLDVFGRVSNYIALQSSMWVPHNLPYDVHYTCFRSTCFQKLLAADQLLAGRPCIQCLHGLAHLVNEFHPIANNDAHHHIQSAVLLSLIDCYILLSTIVNWAFQVAAVYTSNSLPQSITSALPLPVFRARLKTCVFLLSFSWL